MRGQLGALLVLAGGCVHAPSYFRADNVAIRLNCPQSQVKITDVGDARTRLAEGCGRSEMYTQVGPFDEWIPMQDLRKRASFDLDCPPEALTLVPLSTGRQQGVKGCGKKAVYNYAQISEDQYDWVAEASPGRVEATPAP